MLPLWALIFVMAAGQAPRPGGPDFSASSIAVEPAQPVEGDIVTLTLIVRNTGGETATNAEIDLQLPRAGMFVDAGGEAIADLDTRVVSWQGGIDAGATRTNAVRLILLRDAGGETLLLTMRVRPRCARARVVRALARRKRGAVLVQPSESRGRHRRPRRVTLFAPALDAITQLRPAAATERCARASSGRARSGSQPSVCGR